MTFYEEWFDVKGTDKESEYIKAFLDSAEYTLSVLLHGNTEELIIASRVLLGIPIDTMIDSINGFYEYDAKDIVQYSNFEHATKTICNLLEFESKEMSFSKIGKRIMNAPSETAQRKYGENHAKLAAEFTLVNLNRHSEFIVSNTSFGSFSTSLAKKDLYEIIRRLGLRNKFIKAMIRDAKNGIVYYSDYASKVLSLPTVNRRKANMKFLLNMILAHNSIKDNIIW